MKISSLLFDSDGTEIEETQKTYDKQAVLAMFNRLKGINTYERRQAESAIKEAATV